MTEQEILLQITELKERATAASLECIKHLDKDNGNIKDYLKALAEHTTIVKEINQLKNLLKEKV